MEYNAVLIGAHHGTSWNNVNFLEYVKRNPLNTPEDIRLKCILVEPVKELYEHLKENMLSHFPNNVFEYENCAIGATTGELTLYKPDVVLHCENELEYIEKKLPYYTDMLTSVLPNHVKRHGVNVNVSKLTVPSLSLNSLFSKYNITSLNRLFVDTEGSEFDILNSFDFKVKPKRIRFEHKHIEGTNQPTNDKYDIIVKKLIEQGYVISNKNTEDTVADLIQ